MLLFLSVAGNEVIKALNDSKGKQQGQGHEHHEQLLVHPILGHVQISHNDNRDHKVERKGDDPSQNENLRLPR